MDFESLGNDWYPYAWLWPSTKWRAFVAADVSEKRPYRSEPRISILCLQRGKRGQPQKGVADSRRAILLPQRGQVGVW